MNIDEKIKQALQQDVADAEQILAPEPGLFARLFGLYSGKMKRWNMFGTLLAFATAILMFWCGYEFFVSVSLEDRVFWGVLLILSLVGNMGLKIWFWMEMNRHSMSREIKRVELAVAQLNLR